MSGPSPWGDRGGASTCSVHDELPAAYECEGCGAALCEDCVNVGKYLTTCGLCGEIARPLPGTVPRERPESSWTPGESKLPEEAHPGVVLTNHVVVPGAVIAMVTALLFFLVDVRSVFLPLGIALKWLGFWFVFATVLIARYGKLSSDRERQGCYSVALGVAMALVLVIQPWEKRAGEPIGVLVNGAIVLAVWRYATRLTASLSREGEATPPVRKGLRLYGVERLRFEAWEREQDDARLRLKRQERKAAEEKKKGDAHGNPSAAVARLAALALLVFAVGEPLVLAGEPEVGERALAAMVVFLFSAGSVLAAGSAVGTLRHARRKEGRVSERLVPVRVATAGLLMVVLLTVALATPGVVYRGTGELRPGAGPRAEKGEIAGEDAEAEEEPDGRDASREEGGTETQEGSRGPTPPPVDLSVSLSPATTMLNFLAVLGKLLGLPFVIAMVLGGLYVLARLAPFLAKMKLTGWQAWLARLAAVLARRPKEEKGRAKPLSAQLDLDGLQNLSPRECVVTGYTRLLSSLEALGYPVERRTPYEFLAGLPAHLGRIRKPLDRLTSLYVRAAYSSEEMEERDRRETVSVMAEIRSGLPS